MSPGSAALEVVRPDWAAPASVRALCTTRGGGSSAPPYASFNLATHVGDAPAAVAANRRRLREALGLVREPCWLGQVHGTSVVDAAHAASDVAADASYAMGPGAYCAILSADCLPILLCDQAGTRVAAIHAGWRGLEAGIIGAAIARLAVAPARLLAWLGPGIGPAAYVVGTALREAFCARDPAFGTAFRQEGSEWHADLAAIARHQLAGLGVTQVSAYAGCTFAEADRFYSYRRDGITGRMASLIWIGPPDTA